MEGRLRVSVVATGIDAESMQKLPPNVQKLHDRMKQQAVPQAPAKLAEPKTVTAPMMTANPVREQQTSISQHFDARSLTAETVSVDESLILGTQPAIEEEPMPEPQPIQVTARAMPLRPAAQEPEPKRLFGIFRRDAKPEARVEPAPRMQQQLAPRATTQVLNRNTADTSRATQQASDLFEDQKKDDQFEIPAFLRRQQN
jgi:cell division protein FtsZ